MPSDNLDDLFRQQLGGHATPPGENLQRRLAELAEAERLDALFRTGLGSVASQPRREVWERLEDEHLRPQPRRRVLAWWQWSAAAVLLLTLLAGGLWQGGYLQPAGDGLASRSHQARTIRPQGGGEEATEARTAEASEAQSATAAGLASTTAAASEKNQKTSATQATATASISSSPSIATTTRPRRAATAPRVASSSRKLHQQPDAAAGQLANTGRRNSPASQPLPASLEGLAVAPATHPSLPVVAMTSASEVVEVEVRRGAEPSHVAPAPVVAAAEVPTAPDRQRRLRLGGLLRQANHLVHHEPLNLAEATSVAENVTVQARFGGRTLSKTIQL